MPAIALLGTASDVGKSILTTALCRIFANAGYQVAPYKAQNMSNNAAVTPDGLEIGRAQLVQAEACRQPATTDMNPVLIKPTTDVGAQVILHGRVLGNTTAATWFRDTSRARAESYAALQRLVEQFEVVVMEGAGSCAEVNLRDRDYVNFDAAFVANAPVLLVADIDRGGVFAQVLGSLACMPERDRAQVAGILINRFRGDIRLFEDGIRYIEEKSGLSVLGVIPYLYGLDVESEDAIPDELPLDPPERPCQKLARIGIIRLPHIANFTDFLAFEGDPVEVHYLSRPRDLASYDLILLPGTKNTRFDLEWLNERGWADTLLHCNKPIIGICGGYQVLGREVSDPYGVEGDPGVTLGLGLLPVTTVLTKQKTLRHTQASWEGHAVYGYEIHMGETAGDAPPMLATADREVDRGAMGDRVMGCYLHGLFDTPAARAALLAWATGKNFDVVAQRPDHRVRREAAYDRLAAHVRKHINLEKLANILGLERGL